MEMIAVRFTAVVVVVSEGRSVVEVEVDVDVDVDVEGWTTVVDVVATEVEGAEVDGGVWAKEGRPLTSDAVPEARMPVKTASAVRRANLARSK